MNSKVKSRRNAMLYVNENRENLPKMCAHNFQKKKKGAQRKILFAKCVLFYTMGAFSKLKGVFSQCPPQFIYSHFSLCQR
jgi:hypothetical protein